MEDITDKYFNKKRNDGTPSVIFDESLKIISGSRTKNYERVFQKQNIPGKKPLLWINNPQYYFSINEIKEDDRIHSDNISVFISGCTKNYAKYFKENNFKTFNAAREAVLSVYKNHFGKKSIKELIRAGKRNGEVIEIPFSTENNNRLEQFKKLCTHGSEPQLKYFFNDQFLPATRLFVFEEFSGEWAGAILTAEITKEKIRTDLLLRRKDAPKGVMEVLIYKIFKTLKEEGMKSWSLGDVPYVVYNSPLISAERLINFTGRRLRFAYNYSGLFHFKNKFNPDWNDSYICCNTNHPFVTILKISWVSNLLKLIFYKFRFSLQSLIWF